METKPLKHEHHLELENLSLKLQLIRRNAQEMEQKLTQAAEKIYQVEGLDTKEWSIDLDRGVFVKNTPVAGPVGPQLVAG